LLAVSVLSTCMLDAATASSATAGRCNTHFTNVLTFPIPGRGLALSWAPPTSRVAGGHALAVGGHLVGAQTFLQSGERYDTKLFDTTTGAYLKRFGVHYWWVIANTWTVNPYLGEVIADGGGDHAAKVFLADGPGTDLGAIQSADARGRYAIADGALPGIIAAYGHGSPGLANINAWITALAFSPDGGYLAGASKDGSIRVWQITDTSFPEDQFRVVKVFYDPSFGPTLSVRWSPDGTMLAASSRSGHVVIHVFDPVDTRWDEGTIAAFHNVSADNELAWLNANLPLVADAPVWQRSESGAIWNVRYSPSGVYLATAGDDAVLLFDLSTDDSGLALLPEGHGLDFSPDGHYLAVGGGDGHVYVFAPASSAAPVTLYDVLQGHTESVVSAVAWSPDGSRLASVAGGPLLGDAAFNQSIEGNDDNVRVWAPVQSPGVECTTSSTTTTTTVSSSTIFTTTTSSTTTTVSRSTTSTTTTSSTTTPRSSTTSTTIPQGSGAYPGFGSLTTGGQGYPTFLVTTSTDAGAGSLRDALAQAERAGGGTIRFAVSDAGDIHPRPNLIVPPNTTIDATGSHITLWGGNESFGDGVLDVWNSNVIVIGLRVRDARNDGIQVAPKNAQGQDIANIVIDRCSVTGSADGGIDVTGHDGHTVSGITIMRSFIAGSGRYCEKGLCGGGSLFKYGASAGSYYANVFFSNLERTPEISGAGSKAPVVADLRYNLVQATQSSSMSVRAQASANIIGNFFADAHDGARLWPPAQAYFGGGNTDQNTDANPADHLAAPLPVPAPPAAFSLQKVLGAGAVPRDAIDTCYLDLPAPSFSTFRAAPCDRTAAP
jgi:WD40 repeat protein